MFPTLDSVDGDGSIEEPKNVYRSSSLQDNLEEYKEDGETYSPLIINKHKKRRESHGGAGDAGRSLNSVSGSFSGSQKLVNERRSNRTNKTIEKTNSDFFNLTQES